MQISYDSDVTRCSIFGTYVLKSSPMQIDLTWMYNGIQVLTIN